MQVLIPDDPVLAASFVSLETPLFYELHYYFSTQLTADQVSTVRTAYDSWGELARLLPPRFHTPSPDAVTGDDVGYVLEGVAGQRLTRLYALDAGQHVGHLEACYTMLRRAQLDAWADPLASVLRQINSDDDVDLVDRLRRVLEVFRLPSPPRLLPSVSWATSGGPETTLALDAEQERAYRAHCEKVVQILSAGDRFTYVTHLALYAM